MLALDGGGAYLDRRQLQNAADAAALAGAEKLMVVNPTYGPMHDQALGNLVQNLPGTSLPTTCAPCPSQKTVGAPGGNGVGTLSLGAQDASPRRPAARGSCASSRASSSSP